MEEDKFIGKPTNEWHAIARGLLEMQRAYLVLIHEDGLPPKNDNDADMASLFIADLATDLLKK
jgi:hypothetical protein